MKPGRELDTLMAKALGWRQLSYRLWHDGDGRECWIDDREGAWSPSTDIAAAWPLVEKLAGVGYVVSVCWGPGLDGRQYASIQMQLSMALATDLAFCNPRDMDVKAETVPLAICLAALKVFGVEVEG